MTLVDVGMQPGPATQFRAQSVPWGCALPASDLARLSLRRAAAVKGQLEKISGELMATAQSM